LPNVILLGSLRQISWWVELGEGCGPRFGSRHQGKPTMSLFRTIWGALVVLCIGTTMASIPASAQQGQKPNILFIMGDDIGWMQPSIYHREHRSHR
jgi:hypothetical protein